MVREKKENDTVFIFSGKTYKLFFSLLTLKVSNPENGKQKL